MLPLHPIGTGLQSKYLVPFYLMVSPQPSQSIGIHYPEDFGFLVFPSDEVFVPVVRKQLIDVIPKQSTVYRGKGRKHNVENISG